MILKIKKEILKKNNALSKKADLKNQNFKMKDIVMKLKTQFQVIKQQIRHS